MQCQSVYVGEGVCVSVNSTLETLFLILFSIFFFLLVEQVLGSFLVKTEFRYLWQFLRRSKITTEGNVKCSINDSF